LTGYGQVCLMLLLLPLCVLVYDEEKEKLVCRPRVAQ